MNSNNPTSSQISNSVTSHASSEPSTETNVEPPKGIVFIMFTEVCEVYCFYGVRGVLIFYLRDKLSLTELDSKIVFHCFGALNSVCSLVGAALSDGILGKFKTIICFSIIYGIGMVLLSLSAYKQLGLPQLTVCFVSLSLIALGNGSSRPCVSSFGGDQFILPHHERHLEIYFAMFNFSIRLGVCFSTIVTPLLKSKVQCDGENNCYTLAFGVSTVSLIFAIILLTAGKSLYKHLKPKHKNILWVSVACITYAIKMKITTKVKVNHWLDHSIQKYGNKFVKDVKKTLFVMFVLLPFPLFWALFEQQGSGWTIQASRMKGNIGDITILPEQMIAAHSVLILFIIPTFAFCLYPFCAKYNLLSTSLERMMCGGILTGISFIISGCVAYAIEAKGPALPVKGQCQIRIYNILNCTVKFTALPYIKDVEIKTMGYKKFKIKKVHGKNYVAYRIVGCNGTVISANNFQITEKKAFGNYLTNEGLKSYEDDITKHKASLAKIRTLVNINSEKILTYRGLHDDLSLQIKINNNSLLPINPDSYRLEGYGETVSFFPGGVYTVLVDFDEKIKDIKIYEITKSNSVEILWLIPQYFILTLGEACLSSGLKFAYTQAPDEMKTVMTSVWLLTASVGHVIVVIIEALQIFQKQSDKFFMYGGLMLIDIAGFALLSKRYKYFETNQVETVE